MVVVNYALEKDLSEEADVASYTKNFFKLFVQAKAITHLQISPLQALFQADKLTKLLQLIFKHAGNNAFNDLKMHVVG